eukprot:5584-Chlamydomonas_euryale.AAC.1
MVPHARTISGKRWPSAPLSPRLSAWAQLHARSVGAGGRACGGGATSARHAGRTARERTRARAPPTAQRHLLLRPQTAPSCGSHRPGGYPPPAVRRSQPLHSSAQLLGCSKDTSTASLQAATPTERRRAGSGPETAPLLDAPAQGLCASGLQPVAAAAACAARCR